VTERSWPGGQHSLGDDHGSGHQDRNLGHVFPSEDVVGHHVTQHVRKCGTDMADGTAERLCQHVRLVRCGCGAPLVWLVVPDASCPNVLTALYGRAA
jgi:hypothetical protein